MKRKALAGGLLALLGGVLAAAWFWGGDRAAALIQGERLSCGLPAPAANVPHPGMVWVPAGSFDFGDTVYPEEQPLRRVSVGGFWIGRAEVTNREFAEFVRATSYITTAERPVDPQRHPGLAPELSRPGAVVFVMPNDVKGRGDITQWWRYVPGANWRHPQGPDSSIEARDDFPVVSITLEDAQAYARWKGHALPSEMQWEWAARAGQPQAGRDREQPTQANTWQGLFPVVNSADDGFVGLAPVGCFAPNALGLYDMIGNAWELTADAWRDSHVDAGGPDQLPPHLRPGTVSQRVIKGGSFLCAPNYCMRYRSGARQPQEDDLGTSHVGFRTILLAPGP